MPVYTGWLMEVYAAPPGSPDAQAGLTVWLLDEAGPRRRLHQSFPVTFYAAGPARQLRLLWSFLRAQPIPLSLARSERRELFSGQMLPMLEVRVARPADQPPVFHQAARRFPDLTYYDADIPLPLRHAARYGTFPLARCRVTASAEGELRELQVLDSPWDLDPAQAPLRRLYLEPDCEPAHASPRHLLARAGRACYRLPLDPPRPLLANLRALLRRHDPDLLLCAWGDTWLLPRLLELAGQVGLPLPLNRDPYCSAEFRRELSYFSYGQVVHRGQQVHLFGRWHLDRHNAMLWGDYDVEGVLENARVTALPVQTAARVSPGTGISSMQMTTALRQGILVPWHKQQAERPRPAAEMFSADQGGLVYQPIVGLHQDVGAVDFISMYPGIMVRFNISPETAGAGGIDPRNLAPLDEPPGASTQQHGLGLVPLRELGTAAHEGHDEGREAPAEPDQVQAERCVHPLEPSPPLSQRDDELGVRSTGQLTGRAEEEVEPLEGPRTIGNRPLDLVRADARRLERQRHAQPRERQCRLPCHAGEARPQSSQPYAPLPREPGAAAKACRAGWTFTRCKLLRYCGTIRRDRYRLFGGS